jgi:hypothetical protein
MLEEMLKEQEAKKKKRAGIKLTCAIITGSARYERDCPNEWRKSFNKIGVETMAQLESEQYLMQKGFTCVWRKP